MKCACAILLSVACPALQYFSTLSHNRNDFRENNYCTENVCFDFLYNFCLKHLLFWEELSEILSYMSGGLHVKYILCLSDFNETWTLTVFLKILKISNFMKIRPVGGRVVPLSQTSGRTDRHDEATY